MSTTTAEGVSLLLETDEGMTEVTIDFDFTTFTPDDIRRVHRLGMDSRDPKELTIAFLFVKAAQQVDLEDAAWPGFRDGLMPIFDGDPDVVAVEGIG